MVLVGVDADPDPWKSWLDWRWPLQVGEEDAQLRTLWTDTGETPMSEWIKCSDELPPLDTPAWLRMDGDVMIIGERASSTR